MGGWPYEGYTMCTQVYKRDNLCVWIVINQIMLLGNDYGGWTVCTKSYRNSYYLLSIQPILKGIFNILYIEATKYMYIIVASIWWRGL